MTEMELKKLNAPKLISLNDSYDLNRWINKNTFKNNQCNHGILVIFKSDKISKDFTKTHVRIIREDCEVGGCIKAINAAIREIEDSTTDYDKPTVHDQMGYYSSGYDGKFTKEGCRWCKHIYVCTNNIFMTNSGFIKSQSEVIDIPLSEICGWGGQLKLYNIDGQIEAHNELTYGCPDESLIVGRRFCNMNLYYI